MFNASIDEVLYRVLYNQGTVLYFLFGIISDRFFNIGTPYTSIHAVHIFRPNGMAGLYEINKKYQTKVIPIKLTRRILLVS